MIRLLKLSQTVQQEQNSSLSDPNLRTKDKQRFLNQPAEVESNTIDDTKSARQYSLLMKQILGKWMILHYINLTTPAFNF